MSDLQVDAKFSARRTVLLLGAEGGSLAVEMDEANASYVVRLNDQSLVLIEEGEEVNWSVECGFR